MAVFFLLDVGEHDIIPIIIGEYYHYDPEDERWDELHFS